MTWRDIEDWATTLPETTADLWYGTPGLKVAGKGFARFRSDEEGGVVILCSIEEKDRLLATGDDSYYTTPHYDGYGAIIVDLDQIPWDELTRLLLTARESKAPKRLR